MATQYQVAYSSEVTGAAITAGGPFYCAANNIAIALENCMKYPELISVDALLVAAKEMGFFFFFFADGFFCGCAYD